MRPDLCLFCVVLKCGIQPKLLLRMGCDCEIRFTDVCRRLCARSPAVGESPGGDTEGSHIRGFRADKRKGGPFLDRDDGLG